MEEDKKYIKSLIDLIDRSDIIRYLCIITEDIVKEVYGLGSIAAFLAIIALLGHGVVNLVQMRWQDLREL